MRVGKLSLLFFSFRFVSNKQNTKQNAIVVSSPLTLVMTFTVAIACPEDCALTTSLPSVCVGNFGSTNSGCTLVIQDVRCCKREDALGL